MPLAEAMRPPKKEMAEATTAHTRNWVSPAAPTPSSLPPKRWFGDTDDMTTSTTRLVFSSMTPFMTAAPHTMRLMYMTLMKMSERTKDAPRSSRSPVADMRVRLTSIGFRSASILPAPKPAPARRWWTTVSRTMWSRVPRSTRLLTFFPLYSAEAERPKSAGR